MNPEQTPKTADQLLAERDNIVSAIEEKRKGRQAMLDANMEVEPEEDDMDMQDLLANLAEINVALAELSGNQDDQPRLDGI